MSGAAHSHDEHDLALPSDGVREITPVAAPALDPEQIASSEDGWMDPVTEAAHSAPIEQNTDFTSYETRVAEPLDLSPAMGYESLACLSNLIGHRSWSFPPRTSFSTRPSAIF